MSWRSLEKYPLSVFLCISTNVHRKSQSSVHVGRKVWPALADFMKFSFPLVIAKGTPMAYRLDIEELRTQVASERLAREQGDDRCMENMRDLINEERCDVRWSV